MLAACLQFLVCAVVIIAAGTFLTKYADAIAEITRLGRLLIGSILLAGTTSLPELTVDISAVRQGDADLAVGDLLGSSLMNLLILALLDFSVYSRGKMLSKQAAAHALSGSLSVALTALAGIGLFTGSAFVDYSPWGISPAVLIIGAAYAFGVRVIYLDQRIAAQSEMIAETPPADSAPLLSLRHALLGFSICAIAIVIAGPYLADAAGQIAKLSGLGSTFVGTTLVAFSTSLPELVSMLAALRIGAVDLAIGNVFGSNAFNMVLLLPLDLFDARPLLAIVSHGHIVTCLATILASQVVIMGQLYRVESRMRFIEPDAWLVIAIVIGALGLVYYLS
ncbi:Inner membrane protein YrbG [Anatilimnocola aggregata]|uniref:Inner membrane protein YrbG n=1 Tax=Anatilimnocola aggregata TaxID=2528021 RepID=A0A517YFA9_9BACT|nr:sodium:calcium antiporter [Anatilimnocola aggregata]QDU28909.1 Inner membrane protein YrbG [Anatilimnocola aggregata]